MVVPGELREFHGVVMRAVMGRLSALIQHHGLTPAQVSALFRLRADGPQPVSRLGADLGLTSGTISHLVEQIVRRGLVDREASPVDRRRRDVTLTASGRRFLEEFDAGLEEALTGILAGVPAAALDDLARSLRAVLAHVR